VVDILYYVMISLLLIDRTLSLQTPVTHTSSSVHVRLSSISNKIA
jgi:hypothetical protein